MNAILPIGFASFRETQDAFEHALFAGTPERPEVLELRRKLGPNIGDGVALAASKKAIWEAVDQGKLRLVAVGGSPRRIITLDAETTHSIPHMRRTDDLTYLRPSHRLHREFVAWFGLDLGRVTLAFRSSEVKAHTQRLMRGRRRKRIPNTSTRHGRPSLRAPIKQAIEQIVHRNAWSSTQSIKQLAVLVNRHGSVTRLVSEDTVRRALDELHRKDGDRRYARAKRQR